MNLKKNIESKVIRNFYVNIIAFSPFVLLLITGIIMLIYHTGKTNSVEIFGFNGDTWLFIHKTLTIIAVPIVIIHLILHIGWFKKLFTSRFRNKHKGTNVALFIFFLLCTLTSLLSWFVLNDSTIDKGLRDIHNKFGIVLITIFVIHIINNFKWVINIIRKIQKQI